MKHFLLSEKLNKVENIFVMLHNKDNTTIESGKYLEEQTIVLFADDNLHLKYNDRIIVVLLYF